MWTVDEGDFKKIRSWGLDENPFAAVEDWSEMKKELRWLNSEHRAVFVDYMYRRFEYIAGKNFDDYYKRAEKPIDRKRWQYLKERKAYYIMPLGWDNIAKETCRVLDVGCGDGDTVQRMIEFVEGEWKKHGVKDKKVHIVGVDLNPSRVENAKKLVVSENPNITFEFHVGNIVADGLAYADGEYDYSLATGVLEILEDEPCERLMNEMCRVTKKGIYIEDLYERFPGGYPRDNLPEMFAERKFGKADKKVILSEPFDVEHLRDPKKIWPVMLIQNLWVERG